MMITARGCESARKNPRICGELIVFGESVQSKATSPSLASGIRIDYWPLSEVS